MLVSHEDAARFYRLTWGLQFFIGRQRQRLPDIRSLEEYTVAPSATKIAIRDLVWENPDLIDVYADQNPDGLSEEELGIVRSWKRFVAGKFTVYRYLKDGAIFIGDSQVYAVMGLHDRFENVFSGRPLPIWIEAVLLPYQGKVIYDGVVRTYNVYLGAGIRGGLKEEYLTAKQNERIITSLEPEASVLEPRPQACELGTEIKAAAADVVKSSERLRGGDAVQGATFGLLRVSAKVAHSAANTPEDLDEVRRLARQVQTALTRLRNVLDRAEQ